MANGRMPTYEECQPKEGEPIDPSLVFQWAMSSFPFAGGSPLIVQDSVRPEWSKLFYDFGFRHHPDLQTKWISEPILGEKSTFNGAVVHLEEGEKPPPPEFVQDPAQMTSEARARQIELYRSHGFSMDADPRGVGGESASEELFNPADHSPSVVIGYLMGQPATERRRVLASEMNNKRRQPILRAYPGE